MINITVKSLYAVDALVELARSGAVLGSSPLPIGEIARRRSIPVQFLEQILSTLRRSGILRSQRGVRGGYSLARPAADVTVLQVVESLEGELGAEWGEASGVFADAVGALRAVLAGETIEAAAAREERAAKCHMYHI